MIKGYILFRLAKIGVEENVIQKIMAIESNQNYQVEYCCVVFGAWDLMCEILYKDQTSYAELLTKIRALPIRNNIEEMTTLHQKIEN